MTDRSLEAEALHSQKHDTFMVRVHDGRVNHMRLTLRPATFEALMRGMIRAWQVSGRKL